MRLLDRYLLRELIVPLGYCLSGFMILLVVSDLIAELGDLLQKYQLSAGEIAAYYLVKMPEFLAFVLPIALLLALLYALTNHARHQEITAIRAAGISLWRLCLPYLMVGLLASTVVFAVNEFWAPGSDEAADRIKARHQADGPGASEQRLVSDLGFSNSEEGRLWKIGRYDTETGEMANPQVFQTQTDGSRLSLWADRANRSNGVWTFFNARLWKHNPQTNMLPTLLLHTNLLARPEFSETPEQIRSVIKINNSMSLRRTRRADVPIGAILNYMRFNPHPSRAEGWAWLHTMLQGRLAMPWTCLVVVLIAVPFGVASGRRNVFAGVAGSISICFAYFVVQQVCLALGAGGHLPPWVAGWLPNLAFGAAGVWLAARVR